MIPRPDGAEPSLRDRNRQLAERIVRDLLDVVRDDIYDVTHGNYSAKTFRYRIEAQWIERIEAVLASSQHAEKERL